MARKTLKKTDNVRLNMLGLPVIGTLDDFSALTHLSKYSIFQLSKNSGKYYKVYEIPKKSGKKREIAQPSRKLKALQSWILVHILNKLKVSSSCKGFEKGQSILENANPHVGSNAILNIDLKDFFPSVKSNYVFNIFKSLGYDHTISTILTNICTFQGKLPQGSPCSPKLANLACWQLDNRIQGYVGKRGITYTRYADDLTFSGLSPNKVIKIAKTVDKIIQNEGLLINTDKTHFAGTAKAKKVTGLVINDKSAGIGKKKYHELRAKFCNLAKPENQEKKDKLYHAVGWLSFLKSVDIVRYKRILHYIATLKTKYPNTQLDMIKTDQ